MTDEELRLLFDAVRQDMTVMRGDMTEMRQEMEQRFEAVTKEFAAVRRENAESHGETRRHFDVALESARHETQLVAEGVSLLDEKLDRNTTRLDAKIDATSAETHAMLKFSHADLNRRVATLEKT